MTKPLTKEEKDARAAARASKAGSSSKPKATSKPKASKAKPPKAAKAKGDAPAPAKKRGKEIDVASLKPGETVKMLAATHRLQKKVETCEAAHERAKRDAREAKAKLEKARTALAKEIDDQRFGPGELYGPGADTMHVKGDTSDRDDDDDDQGDGELAEAS